MKGKGRKGKGTKERGWKERGEGVESEQSIDLIYSIPFEPKIDTISATGI